MHKARRAIAVIAFAIASCAACARATTPFPTTAINQGDNGKWICPRGMLTMGLVIVDRHKNSHILSLHEMFPGGEYESHVVTSSAGPIWGEGSIFYVTQIQGTSYFSLQGLRGKRLLINLDAAKIEKPDRFAEALQAADEKEVRTSLTSCAAALLTTAEKHLSSYPDEFDDEKLHAAIQLAMKYHMTDLHPELDIVERYGPRVLDDTTEIGNTAYGSGMDPAFYLEYPRTNATRESAQTALRTLGFAPQGYPITIFEPLRADKAIAPADRLRAAKALKRGMTAQQVYESLGPPDSIDFIADNDGSQPRGAPDPNKVFDLGTDAWRYDWGPDPDLSLYIAWGAKGRVQQVIGIRPAAWHVDLDPDQKPAWRKLKFAGCAINCYTSKKFKPTPFDFLEAPNKERDAQKEERQ